MSSKRYAGWSPVTKDGIVSERATLVHGVILTVATTGDSITLYNGQDGTSGRLCHTFKGEGNITHPYIFPKPLLFSDGVFADTSVSTVRALILFSPVDEEQITDAPLPDWAKSY